MPRTALYCVEELGRRLWKVAEPAAKLAGSGRLESRFAALGSLSHGLTEAARHTVRSAEDTRWATFEGCSRQTNASETGEHSDVATVGDWGAGLGLRARWEEGCGGVGDGRR